MRFNLSETIEYQGRLWKVVAIQANRYALQNKAGKMLFVGEIDLIVAGAVRVGARIIQDQGVEIK